MKLSIIIFITFTLNSCSTNTIKNKVTEKKSITAKKSLVVAKNRSLRCRSIKKTGSRIHTKRCTTKEERDFERDRTQDVLKNYTNFQKNIPIRAKN